MENLTDEQKAKLKLIHENLKPIAERAAYIDTQRVARLNMQMIETLLGEEVKTQVIPRHHA